MIDWHMHLHNITVEVAAANLAQNEIDALEHFRAVAEHARTAIEELEASTRKFCQFCQSEEQPNADQ